MQCPLHLNPSWLHGNPKLFVQPNHTRLNGSQILTFEKFKVCCPLPKSCVAATVGLQVCIPGPYAYPTHTHNNFKNKQIILVI